MTHDKMEKNPRTKNRVVSFLPNRLLFGIEAVDRLLGDSIKLDVGTKRRKPEVIRVIMTYGIDKILEGKGYPPLDVQWAAHKQSCISEGKPSEFYDPAED